MSPKTTPSYRICPRCDQRDNYYLAPRVVGQIGIARNFEIGDAEFIGGGAQPVEKEVELCKNCGERVKYVAPVVEYSAEETRQRGKQGVKSGLFIFVASSIATYFIARHYLYLPDDSTPWLIASVTSTMVSLLSLVFVFSSAKESLK
jgi:hypothetical protein